MTTLAEEIKALMDLGHTLERATELATQDRAKSADAPPAAPRLVDLLKDRLSAMDASPSIVELSPKGGMLGQVDKPFGNTLYGIAEPAKAVAKLADSTFSNFAQKKVDPNKTYYTMGALLSGMGTGKSAFLDRHLSLLREFCQNKVLKNLLRPESHPLVLNVTLNSGTDFLPSQGSDSGEFIIARRLVSAYTKASWGKILAARADHPDSLCVVLGLIVDHHRRMCNMTNDQQMVVVINLDELNQIHKYLLDKNTADLRLREVVTALRSLSMTGVAETVGVGPAVLCLLAGTGDVAFRQAMCGSGIEFIVPSLPLLSSSEVMALMVECAVHHKYLSHTSFLQLLEDTAGVPRLLRKVLEGLTVWFAESCIAEARTNALRYVESGQLTLSLDERAALIPFIVHGAFPPDMSSPLVKHSSRTFEDLRMTGAIFQEANQLVMPVLLLEALFPSMGIGAAGLMNRLIYWYHERTWSGFEMFGALFHALKMRHWSGQGAKEVSMKDFYPGAVMPPEVANIKITLQKSVEYYVSGQPTDIGTYQFPGTDKTKNKLRVDQLQQGVILLNGLRAPAGDCLIVNPLGGGETGMLVRSLCVSHTVDHLALGTLTIGDDHRKAKDAFDRNPELFGKDTKLVSVHLSNRELHTEAQTPREDCVVIGRDQVPKFFGLTFQRGLLSPTHAAALRAANSPRSFSRASHAGNSRLTTAPAREAMLDIVKSKKRANDADAVLAAKKPRVEDKNSSSESGSEDRKPVAKKGRTVYAATAAAAAAAAKDALGKTYGERPDGCNTLFVANIPWDIKESQLYKLFGTVGEVSSVRLTTSKEDGSFRGFGFVSFVNGDNVLAAIKLTGTRIGGRNLRLDFALPKAGSCRGGGGRGTPGGCRGGGGRGTPGGCRGGGGRGTPGRDRCGCGAVFGAGLGGPPSASAKNNGTIVPSTGKKTTFD